MSKILVRLLCGFLFAVANVIMLSSGPKTSLPPVTVNVNRPFAFFIIHRATKNALFNGQVYNVNPPATVSERINFMDTPPKQELPIFLGSSSPKFQLLQSKDKSQNIKHALR